MANAADRHEGAVVPNVRGENTNPRARNSMSTNVEFLDGRISEEVENDETSMLGVKLRDGIMTYNCVMKSLKSIFNASPVNEHEEHV